MQPQRLYARIALELIEKGFMRRASALKKQRDLAWESYRLSLKLDHVPRDSFKRVTKDFFMRSWSQMVMSLEKSNPNLIRHEDNSMPRNDQLKKNSKGQIIKENGKVVVVKNNHWVTHSPKPFSGLIMEVDSHVRYAYALNLIVTDPLSDTPSLHYFQVGYEKLHPMSQAILDAVEMLNQVTSKGVAQAGSMRTAWAGNVRQITDILER